MQIFVLAYRFGSGAIGGLIFALLVRKETRELVRERSGGTVDYVNRQAKKLRDASEGIADKAKELMSQCCGSVDATTEGEKQSRQQERRET